MYHNVDSGSFFANQVCLFPWWIVGRPGYCKPLYFLVIRVSSNIHA